MKRVHCREESKLSRRTAKAGKVAKVKQRAHCQQGGTLEACGTDGRNNRRATCVRANLVYLTCWWRVKFRGQNLGYGKLIDLTGKSSLTVLCKLWTLSQNSGCCCCCCCTNLVHLIDRKKRFWESFKRHSSVLKNYWKCQKQDPLLVLVDSEMTTTWVVHFQTMSRTHWFCVYSPHMRLSTVFFKCQFHWSRKKKRAAEILTLWKNYVVLTNVVRY